MSRKACAEDRRGAFAELTSAGLAKLQDAAPGHVEAVRADLFDALTPDQQRALREISDALVAHLSDAPIWPIDGDDREEQPAAPST